MIDDEGGGAYMVGWVTGWYAGMEVGNTSAGMDGPDIGREVDGCIVEEGSDPARCEGYGDDRTAPLGDRLGPGPEGFAFPELLAFPFCVFLLPFSWE